MISSHNESVMMLTAKDVKAISLRAPFALRPASDERSAVRLYFVVRVGRLSFHRRIRHDAAMLHFDAAGAHA